MVERLCPFRKTAFYVEGKTKKAGDKEEFAPCYGAKCAMWRESIGRVETDGHKPAVLGYCGLSGRP